MLDLFFRKYAWTANLALIFAAAWLAAKTVNTLVGALIRPRPRAELSAPAPAPPRAFAAAIDATKLYHLIGVEPPQEAEGEPPAPVRPQNCKDPGAQPQRTGLRLQLVASVLADHPRWSLATVADLGTHETHVLGVGDRIQGAELLAVERVRGEADPTGNAVKVVAILCNAGTKEYLDYDAAAAAGPVASGGTPNLGVEPVPRPGAVPGAPLEGVRTVGRDRYEIDRKVLDSTLNNLNNIATQARIVPSFKNGVANGFKLFSIQPGSLYSSIGVENGDVIQRVNGYEINSPEKALELYQKLRESGHVTIELERQGQIVRKEYNITGP